MRHTTSWKMIRAGASTALKMEILCPREVAIQWRIVNGALDIVSTMMRSVEIETGTMIIATVTGTRIIATETGITMTATEIETGIIKIETTTTIEIKEVAKGVKE